MTVLSKMMIAGVAVASMSAGTLSNEQSTSIVTEVSGRRISRKMFGWASGRLSGAGAPPPPPPSGPSAGAPSASEPELTEEQKRAFEEQLAQAK